MSDKQQTGTGRRAEIAFPVRLDGKGFRPDTRNGGEFVPLLDAKGLWLADIREFGDAHELIVSALNAHSDMKAALERSKEELTLAADQWHNPNKDGLFKSRVSVLIDKIDAALSNHGEKQ